MKKNGLAQKKKKKKVIVQVEMTKLEMIIVELKLRKQSSTVLTELPNLLGTTGLPVLTNFCVKKKQTEKV